MRQSMYGGMVAGFEKFPLDFIDVVARTRALGGDEFKAFILISWCQFYQLKDGFTDEECANISGALESWPTVKRVLLEWSSFQEKDGLVFNPDIIPYVEAERKGPVPRDKTQRRRFIENWKEIRARIIKRDAGVCQYCGASEDTMHVDHVIPLSRGGSNEDHNLVTACPTCNLSKHAKTEGEWLR